LKISVVTATYNAVSFLPRLIDSLSNQSDKDFQWVVADGLSTDGTLELLKSVQGMDIVILSQEDFGIYDALNRAIKSASGQYYIVCGADDFFHNNAIKDFRRSITTSKADIVTARAKYGSRYLKVRNNAPWLWGHPAYISSHTLGTAFKKDLHEFYGYYSRKYPIAADQLFVMQIMANGASRHVSDFVAGEVGSAGVSSVDRLGNATEIYRVQLALGRSKFIQTLLFLLRLFKSL
jgi:glycosyltransferase involved in cell wall biosynthesis